MYTLEPTNRFPTPLRGPSLGDVDVANGVRFLATLGVGAGLLWLFSRTKPGKKVLRGVRRFGRRS